MSRPKPSPIVKLAVGENLSVKLGSIVGGVVIADFEDGGRWIVVERPAVAVPVKTRQPRKTKPGAIVPVTGNPAKMSQSELAMAVDRG